MAWVPATAFAQEKDLAKEVINPIADLITIPVEANWDFDVGEAGGDRFMLNFQPLVPFSISEDWNLISRTILPVTYQKDVVPGGGNQFGLGDVIQSFFFSPKQPSAGGTVWGIGPVFLLPTATDKVLGAEKWGAGPTAVVVNQSGPWTIGLLGNHIWSFAGDSDRVGLSTTLIQPFVAYTTAKGWTFSVEAESTYDWKADEWTIPINFVVYKFVMLGNRPTSLFVGFRYWADSPDEGAHDVGVRIGMTFMYPQ
jgi:hypothetical protein